MSGPDRCNKNLAPQHLTESTLMRLLDHDASNPLETASRRSAANPRTINSHTDLGSIEATIDDRDIFSTGDDDDALEKFKGLIVTQWNEIFRGSSPEEVANLRFGNLSQIEINFNTHPGDQGHFCTITISASRAENDFIRLILKDQKSARRDVKTCLISCKSHISNAELRQLIEKAIMLLRKIKISFLGFPQASIEELEVYGEKPVEILKSMGFKEKWQKEGVSKKRTGMQLNLTRFPRT